MDCSLELPANLAECSRSVRIPCLSFAACLSNGSNQSAFATISEGARPFRQVFSCSSACENFRTVGFCSNAPVGPTRRTTRTSGPSSRHSSSMTTDPEPRIRMPRGARAMRTTASQASCPRQLRYGLRTPRTCRSSARSWLPTERQRKSLTRLTPDSLHSQVKPDVRLQEIQSSTIRPSGDRA